MKSGLGCGWLSVLMAVAAFLCAAARINHGIPDSTLPPGPGLTVDESFNIDQGAWLADELLQHGPLIWKPSVAREVFTSKRYLPDHPPAGRLLLGVVHAATAWLIPGSESSPYNVPAARLGSCFAFAMMVLLLSEFARRSRGEFAALTASLLVMGMPQVLGHARLAALESATNLAWTAALIPLLAWWTGPTPPTTRQAAMTGALQGILLLTKVQGILLCPVVVVWAMWTYRSRMVRPVLVWGSVALALFVACWPWLWLAPLTNLQRYLGQGEERETLYCWYLGERFADKAVPWHYPFIMTFCALPAGSVVACLSVFRCRPFRDADRLLLLSILVPLMVFAIPGTPVYDGTRLFVIVLPPLALLLARMLTGALTEPEHCMGGAADGRRRCCTCLKLGVVAVLALGAVRAADRIVCLTQYGPLIGGNRGAERLGLESAYWPEGLNADFWKQVPEDSTVMVAPVSHQFQLSDLESLVPIISERRIRLIPFQYDPQREKGLLLLLHRLADLRVSLRTVPDGAREIAVVREGGVLRARLIDTTNATWTECP